MLYSYQWQPGLAIQDGELVTKHVTDKPMHPTSEFPPGFLKPETIKAMWTPVPESEGEANVMYREGGYGMGWETSPYMVEYGTTGDVRPSFVYHSGAAVGISSILFILPSNDPKKPPPRGVCVAILTNMEDVELGNTAYDIAHVFADIKNK
jgi:hypothetical protein